MLRFLPSMNKAHKRARSLRISFRPCAESRATGKRPDSCRPGPRKSPCGKLRQSEFWDRTPVNAQDLAISSVIGRHAHLLPGLSVLNTPIQWLRRSGQVKLPRIYLPTTRTSAAPPATCRARNMPSVLKAQTGSLFWSSTMTPPSPPFNNATS